MNSQPAPQDSATPEDAREPFDYNKRLDELTAKISDIVRSSSLGLIAVAWLGLSSTNESAELVRSLDGRWLMTGATLALVALFLDFGQYVSGYFAVSGDKRSRGNAKHRRSFARKLRFFCFYGKMIAAGTSSVAIISAVSSSVLNLQLWF